MRGSDEIALKLSQMIASIYLRPAMYTPGTDSPESARVLCSLLWTVHWIWTWIAEREGEFFRTVNEVRREAGCVSLDLVGTYRERHPAASFEEQTQFVLAQWKAISSRLGVPLVESTGRSVSSIVAVTAGAEEGPSA
jgi:hypothetical protein